MNKVVSFVSRWNQFANELSIPSLEGGVSALRQIEMIATLAKKAYRLAIEFDAVLPKKADAVFCSAPTNALMGGLQNFRKSKTSYSDTLLRQNYPEQQPNTALYKKSSQEKRDRRRTS